MRRSNSIAFKIFSLPRSSAWKLAYQLSRKLQKIGFTRYDTHGKPANVGTVHAFLAMMENKNGVTEMSKSWNQKLIYLMKILLERIDEMHSMTMAKIIDALAAYDISVERKNNG